MQFKDYFYMVRKKCYVSGFIFTFSFWNQIVYSWAYLTWNIQGSDEVDEILSKLINFSLFEVREKFSLHTMTKLQ